MCAVSNFVGANTGYIYDAAGIRVKVNLNQFSCDLANGYPTTGSYVLGLGGIVRGAVYFLRMEQPF